MNRLVFLLGALLLTLSACAPGSYIESLAPKTLVLRKDISGGYLDLTGTDLNIPGFSLYADGTVIYYGYDRGRRVLYSGRLDKATFFSAMEFVEGSPLCSYLLFDDYDVDPGSDTMKDLPETYLFLNNGSSTCSLSVKGLGMFEEAHPDELISISVFCDTLRPRNFKPYRPNRIRLFVKKMSETEPASIPEWTLSQIPLVSVFKVSVDSYLLNDKRNSIVVSGPDARQVIKLLEVPSIYQKFSFQSDSYLVGYRPLLPDETE